MQLLYADLDLEPPTQAELDAEREKWRLDAEQREAERRQQEVEKAQRIDELRPLMKEKLTTHTLVREILLHYLTNREWPSRDLQDEVVEERERNEPEPGDEAAAKKRRLCM